MSEQVPVSCCLMRGGTSKGPFFNAKDLPKDIDLRNQYLLAAVGSPDKRQIDGVGGAHSLTTKVGIVSLSTDAKSELTFLFAQPQPDSDLIDTTPNCGNMLAAVVPFALETGMVDAKEGETTVRVLTQNTGMLSDITVQTPNKKIEYEGEARIDGVPGTAAPIAINFLETTGSVCGALFPTGSIVDSFTLSSGKEIEVTCIDNGMPMVLMSAKDMGVTGYEPVADYNNNDALKKEINALRLVAAQKMGLGDVSEKNIPKMCLVAEPIEGGAIHTRCYIPHVCHEAVGVLAAVTIATACIYPESVAYPIAHLPELEPKVSLSIEHPTGEFTVVLTLNQEKPQVEVKGAALLRTARLLMKGEVMLPASRVQVK